MNNYFFDIYLFRCLFFISYIKICHLFHFDLLLNILRFSVTFCHSEFSLYLSELLKSMIFKLYNKNITINDKILDENIYLYEYPK